VDLQIIILNPAVEVLAGRNFDAGLQPGRVVNCVTGAMSLGGARSCRPLSQDLTA
jgi:hypothetical protein